MDIQEIPLDNQEEKEEIINDAAPGGAISEDIEQIKEAPAPKKRGRPAGAKNRNPKPKADPPPSPKQPPPKKKKKAPVVEESEEEDEAPRRAMNGLPPNPEIDRRALASEMLNILQQQQYGKSQIRRNHYASWFQNGI